MIFLTASEHEGTLAHAVVIVHVLGAEVCSVDYKAALSACSPTVAFQEQPETHQEEEEEGVRTWKHIMGKEGRGERGVQQEDKTCCKKCLLRVIYFCFD